MRDELPRPEKNPYAPPDGPGGEQVSRPTQGRGELRQVCTVIIVQLCSIYGTASICYDESGAFAYLGPTLVTLVLFAGMLVMGVAPVAMLYLVSQAHDRNLTWRISWFLLAVGFAVGQWLTFLMLLRI